MLAYLSLHVLLLRKRLRNRLSRKKVSERALSQFVFYKLQRSNEGRASLPVVWVGFSVEKVVCQAP